MRRSLRATAIGAVGLLALGLGAVSALRTAPAANAAVSSGGVKFAYFTQWGIYQNLYYPKTMDTQGAASKVNFVQYAFENIDPVNKTCFQATAAASQDESNPNAGDGAGDAFADYQKSYTADISVDGQADVFGQPIAGNFNQLKKLKAKYPNMKILVSLGGWTYSKYFSDVAATDASRKKFVGSCIDMFIRGNLPVQGGYGGPGTAAGIFDGVDIDWEYPGAPGHTGNHVSANDTANYTLLLREFRTELDALGGAHRYLTSAVPAGQDKIAKIQTNSIAQYLDYANVMTYDMHGGFEPTGPANLQDPLFNSPSDPSPVIPPGTGKYSIDAAIKAWTVGDSGYGIPGGFPAAKLTMGYPLYYRGWTGVAAGTSHGLYQPASSPAVGHPLSGSVPGVSFYKELLGIVDNPATTFFDPVTRGAYFYSGNTLWSGDSAQSIQAKADYQHCNGLGGSMVYSLEADSNAALFNRVVTATNGSAANCTNPTGPASPSVTPTATRPTTSPSPTISPTPSPTRTATPTPTATTGPAAPAWAPNTAYTVGQIVTYAGRRYQCRQSHTSIVGWEPPNVLALWLPL
jgi:chitinase